MMALEMRWSFKMGSVSEARYKELWWNVSTILSTSLWEYDGERLPRFAIRMAKSYSLMWGVVGSGSFYGLN